MIHSFCNYETSAYNILSNFAEKNNTAKYHFTKDENSHNNYIKE